MVGRAGVWVASAPVGGGFHWEVSVEETKTRETKTIKLFINLIQISLGLFLFRKPRAVSFTSLSPSDIVKI